MLEKSRNSSIGKFKRRYSDTNISFLEDMKSFSPDEEKNKLKFKAEDLEHAFKRTHEKLLENHDKESKEKYYGEVNGQTYEKEGKGIIYYPNGDKYFGDWQNDKFHGEGVYVFASGEIYKG